MSYYEMITDCLPLEDCPEFGNFVIALTCNSGRENTWLWQTQLFDSERYNFNQWHYLANYNCHILNNDDIYLTAGMNGYLKPECWNVMMLVSRNRRNYRRLTCM
jgi:hypothetical protein